MNIENDIKQLLTTVCEEQIEAMAEHVAKELAMKADGKLGVSIGITLNRTPKVLNCEGGLSFNRKVSLEKTQCSAEIFKDQANLPIDSEQP